MKYLISGLVLALPAVTFAQGLQQYIPTILVFINTAVIPFLLGIAFLVVVINIVRYFIVESTNEEGRAKAKAYSLYSIMAFVLILVFWGIINLLVRASGLDGCAAITPDYFNEVDGFAVPDCVGSIDPDSVYDDPFVGEVGG